ncbi:basic leucine zipper 23-like [Typha latifolia]|uniref:basic leucine zipper 23-like n=1 Tax=Typha latifolia TaxID=4733 RepID=UPI003C2CE92E
MPRMDDEEVDISSQLLLPNSETTSSFNEFLTNTGTCTHTHTCNPPGSTASSHTHTCCHTHTQVYATGEGDKGEEEEPKKSRKPVGNREAVRKYREKKKAHTAYLEEEVKKLHFVNEQLLKRLQGKVALEAEVMRLRSLLADIRTKVDAELGVFPSQKQCDGAGLRSNAEASGWEGNCGHAVDGPINQNGDMAQELDIAEAVNSMAVIGSFTHLHPS